MLKKTSPFIFPLLLLACTPSTGSSFWDDKTTDDTGLDTAEPYNIEITIETLQNSGLHSYSEENSSLSVASCDSDISFIHVQTSKENAPTVLLSHGFARSSSNMVGWAQHWATWGFDVIVVDMCHWMDHAANGAALAELSNQLGVPSPIFAGQSAGGLASLVAASDSPNSIGVLGLDATDDGLSTGASISSQVSAPVLGLIGEPSFCNSDNNGIGMLQATGDATLLRVNDADHCDFEAPTDGGCTAVCQNGSATISEEDIHKTILSLSTAGLLWLGTENSSALDLWTGSQKQTLIDSGAIEGI